MIKRSSTLIAHAARGALFALLALGVLAGCGAQLQPGESSIGAVRERARENPRDPEAASALALAEMFAVGGDPAAADAALASALRHNPRSARVWFASAVQHESHGRPALALQAYLQVLQISRSSTDPVANQLAELSTRALATLEGSVPNFMATAEPALRKALADGGLALPARYGASALLIQLAYRRGDREAVEQLARQVGCLTSFRSAGPFGPRELLGFDLQQAARPGAPLQASYDLGAGRGHMPTRELAARGCAVNLGGGPLASGGTSYAQTHYHAAAAGPHLVRIQSQSSSELFVDGRSLLRLDRRKQLVPEVVFVPVTLGAGRHEITIKVSTRHPNPALSIAIAPQADSDRAAVALPFAPSDRDGFAIFARAGVAVARGDVLSARQILDGVHASGPAAALLLALRASVLSIDPLVPSNTREDDARRLLNAALKRDAGLWNPRAQLSTMMASNGRAKEAIASLRKALVKWPEVPAIGLALAQLLRGQDWDAEADQVIAAIRKRVPDACEPLAAELEALRSRQRERKAAETAEALTRCDARNNARYALLLRQRRFQDASDELERIAALEPQQNTYPWLIARLELAKQRRDEAAVRRYIEELRSAYPRSSNGVLEQVDYLAGRGDEKSALSALQRALQQEPASLSSLQRLVPALGGEHVLSAYRMQGRKALQRFEASGRKYDAPSVLVFDYLATRIFPDGSALELVHTIQKAQSHEAVDELGEVRVPEGARVLTLRTIKPDGRRLEPDQIEGKDTISLPTMAAGDYVEFEYLQARDAPAGFPGGYAGERFYFKSFETPFDHSQMVVIAPREMALQIDPRGAAPAPTERSDGALRVLDFQVEGSAPVKIEPGAVSAREYLPSVRLGARTTWEAFIESIREGLVDRDLYDPEIAALVQQVVGDADPGDAKSRAERLYAWVLENVDNNEDVFSQASVMLRARAGNRARVLRYMLELAGVPASLALARSASADSVPSTMADDDTYEHLLVVFQGPAGPSWLFTVERHAPFGYLPPLLRGQPAMLLTAGAPRVTLPQGGKGQDLRRLVLDVSLSDDGNAAIKLVESVSGAGAVNWRSELESIPKAELERRFEDEYVGRLLPGARLKSLKISGREQSARAIELQYEIEISNFGRRLGDRWALPPLVATHLGASYAQLAARTTASLIPNPLEIEVSVRLHLPSGAKKPALPEAVRLQAALPGARAPQTNPQFTLASRYEGDRLIIDRKLELPAMRVETDAYPEFASFCRNVDLAEGKELYLNLQ
jgi:cellulose synthase operon protein C